MQTGRVLVWFRRMDDRRRGLTKSIVVSGDSTRQARINALVGGMAAMPTDMLDSVVRVVGYNAQGVAVSEYKVTL